MTLVEWNVWIDYMVGDPDLVELLCMNVTVSVLERINLN